MINNETDLARFIKRVCPGMERIENSIKVGNPDCLMPGWLSWDMVELKMIHGNYMYFQKTQLAYFVKARRLQQKYWPMVLGCYIKDNKCIMYMLPDILNATRIPAGKYVHITPIVKVSPKPLMEVLDEFGYLSESSSSIDKRAFYREENA